MYPVQFSDADVTHSETFVIGERNFLHNPPTLLHASSECQLDMVQHHKRQQQQPTPTISIPISAPAGGLSFTQPAQTAAASFYKIAQGQSVTFGWNFTDILSTPQHLTVSAFCSDNGNTYPVGPSNGVIPGNALSVVWDPFAYQQANPQLPLAQGSYTLSIWDDRGPTAGASPGLFSPNSGLRFALYTPQAYTPLASGWTCPGGCASAGPNAVARGIPVALIATSVVLLLSAWGIFRTAMGIRIRDN